MKLMKIMVAALVVAAMAAPAIASDLKLSGSMEVRGYYVSADASDKWSDGYSSYSEKWEESAAWNYQRLRTAGTYSVADGVSVHFRFDVTESPENQSYHASWGSSGQYTQRRADIQYDLAYLQLVKNGVTFKAGELYSGRFGIGNLSDALGAGFVVGYDALTAFHIKQSEQHFVDGTGSLAWTDANGLVDETSLTGLAYVIKTDNFTLTPMVAYTNASGSDADVFGAMVALDSTLGALKLKGEIDMFDGENAAGTVDLKGTQVYLDLSTSVSDTTTVGGMFLWGAAQDGANEMQVTRMGGTGFGGWSPFTFGHNSTDFIFDVTPFEICDNAGMLAGSLYVTTQVSSDLNIQGAVAFATSDDDKVADADAFILNASASYAILPNTDLKFSVNYIDWEENGTSDGGKWTYEEETLQGLGGVYVKF